MKNLNKSQWIAVFAALVFLVYVFSDSIMNMFYQPMTTQNSSNSSLSVEDVVVGSGRAVVSGDLLTVHYTGTLMSGEVFDSSVQRGTPFTFVIGQGQVIRGWEEGLMGMRVGGKRRLIIPPDYGYGDRPAGLIPANSTLIFEVELLDAEDSLN